MATEEHKSDIFFKYKTNAETSRWVEETCRDLERVHIVTSYHEKDFLPGRQIPKSIIECLSQSKHVGVVITPDFDQSDWCKYELQVAMTKVIKSKDSAQIIPLFLNITDFERQLPDELENYIGIDVTGHREQWWDKLVSAIKVPDQGNVQTMHYHFQKLIETYSNFTIEKAMYSSKILSQSPLGAIIHQMGLLCVQKTILSSCGIELENTTVKINFAQLFPNEEVISKILPLQSVFNEGCSKRSFLAFMSCSLDEEREKPFTSQCEIKFYGFTGLDYIKLSLALVDSNEIHFDYNKNKVLAISNETKTSILGRLSQSECDIYFRLKLSRHIRKRFPTTRLPRHCSRGCKNYRNYRKVFFRFPGSSIPGRYTFHRDNFRSENPCPGNRVYDSDSFLLLQKFDHSHKDLIF